MIALILTGVLISSVAAGMYIVYSYGNLGFEITAGNHDILSIYLLIQRFEHSL